MQWQLPDCKDALGWHLELGTFGAAVLVTTGREPVVSKAVLSARTSSVLKKSGVFMQAAGGTSQAVQRQAPQQRDENGILDQQAAFAGTDDELSLRMDALDGTAGMTGPRTWKGVCISQSRVVRFDVEVRPSPSTGSP